MAQHGFLDLKVEARGDTEVDLHHTVEDVGICLGKAFHEALGEKRGIVRFGTATSRWTRPWPPSTSTSPGGRTSPTACRSPRPSVGNFDLELLKDFFRAFAMNAMVNLHVNLHYGENAHHIAEAVFKAFGRALAEASQLDPRVEGVPSTKGTL